MAVEPTVDQSSPLRDPEPATEPSSFAAPGVSSSDSVLEEEPEYRADLDAESPDATPSILPSDEPSTAWGLSEGDRRFLLIACAVILGLTTIQLVRLGLKSKPVFQIATAAPLQIDVNHASWVEWMQLPGIGETTARTIVADRETNGRFQSIDDVQRVRGIGPKKLEQMRSFLKLTPNEE